MAVLNILNTISSSVELTQEDLSGQIEQDKLSYSFQKPFVSGTIEVYLNGLFLRAGVDFVETTDGFKLIEIDGITSVINSPTSILIARYIDSTNYSDTVFKYDDLSDDINGTDLEYFTLTDFEPGSLFVYLNGLLLRKNVDFSETSVHSFSFDENLQSTLSSDYVVVIAKYRRA